MKRLPLILLLCTSTTLGCHYRLFFQRKAEWARPEEAERVKLPTSSEGSISLEGPSLRAIAIAIDDFLPPGSKARSYDKALEDCLSARENYDVSVLKSSEGLFFVSISANLARCGIEEAVLDAGATYAIDAQGRILLKN
jgi:hypothetical protein